MSLVRMTVCGRATTTPEIKEVNGSTCASFGLAAETGGKDEQGNWISIFLWVNVWGKKGESVARNLKKGERVYVFGSYAQRLYVDKNGETKVQNKLTAQDVDYLGGQAQAQDAMPMAGTPGAAPPPSAAPTMAMPTTAAMTPMGGDDDELPF